MRVLTNLLVAHLCCEANSILACATSVKPTAYYPIITKFIIFITKISKNVWRAGLDFLIFSGLRYKLPRHFFLSPVFYSFFSPGRNGFGAHNGKELRVWLTTRWCASSARMAKMTSRIVEPSYEREKKTAIKEKTKWKDIGLIHTVEARLYTVTPIVNTSPLFHIYFLWPSETLIHFLITNPDAATWFNGHILKSQVV